MKNNYDTLRVEFVDFLKTTDCVPVEHAVALFCKEFKQSRRTYFRWKKNIERGLPLNHSDQIYRKVIDRRSKCYFCNTDLSLVVHHKNKNREDNHPENLVVLCNECHRRLHALIGSKHNINVYVVSVQKM